MPTASQTATNPGFADHFSKVAARYADFRPHYPPALLDFLSTLVPQSSTVWDCACYRSIPFPFDEIAAPSVSMHAQWGLDQLLGYFSTWSATNRYIKSTGRNPLEPLSALLGKAWGDPASPRTVTWPLVVRVGRA